MTTQFTGTCVIRMDGLSLQSKEKAKLDIGGKERMPIYADHVLVGFSEKPIAAKVTATLAHSASTDLIAIRDARNVSIDFETDSGVIFLIAGAFATKSPELTAGEGDVDVEFMGPNAVQR